MMSPFAELAAEMERAKSNPMLVGEDVLQAVVAGQGQRYLSKLSDSALHVLIARLEEEAYHRLGVLVGKLED